MLGDDGLRSAVAGEIEDGDLLVDRNALVGAGRKAFTRFVYGRMTGLRIVRSPRPRFTG